MCAYHHWLINYLINLVDPIYTIADNVNAQNSITLNESVLCMACGQSHGVINFNGITVLRQRKQDRNQSK